MDSDVKRELVERVAKAKTFRRAPRLRELLLYVAECTLAERLEDAREQQIALKVFKRTPDDQRRHDNIVRVEARSLRKRLESYFLLEGKDEPILILMPKGGYSLRFEPRVPPDHAVFKAHKSEIRPRSAILRPPHLRMVLTVTAALVFTLLLMLVVRWTLHKVPEPGHPAASFILPFPEH